MRRREFHRGAWERSGSLALVAQAPQRGAAGGRLSLLNLQRSWSIHRRLDGALLVNSAKPFAEAEPIEPSTRYCPKLRPLDSLTR
jgi:hypothetical protein